MISIRHVDQPGALTRSGYEPFCIFDVFWRLSDDDSEVPLNSWGLTLDISKKRAEKRTNLPSIDLKTFRETLASCPWIRLEPSDRLSYIDNDLDQIPIDQESEFVEALKFARDYNIEENENVPLIVIKNRKKTVRSLRGVEKLEAVDDSSDKMPPMRVQCTPFQDSPVPETNGMYAGASANYELQCFLENYKKQIVAEVTEQVLQRMTSAMMLAQNMGPVKEPLPGPSQLFCKKNGEESRDHGKSQFIGNTGNIEAEITEYVNRCGLQRQETSDLIKSSNKQVNGNNSSEERKLGDNDDQVNEKQPSDSDNISILSDHSHMSDFIDDNNYEVIRSEEPPKFEEAAEPRNEASASSEVIDVNDQHSFPEKKPQNPRNHYYVFKPETGPVFDAQTKEKYYQKNIAETSEDTFIDEELVKRSGGAYAYVPQQLEHPRVNLSGLQNSRFTKPRGKKCRTYCEEAAEQHKSSGNSEALQPRRRVVVDHNASKGLGDTKQTSPKKRGSSRTGASSRPVFVDPVNNGPYGCGLPQYYFLPQSFEPWQQRTDQVPRMNQQWTHYPPYPHTMQILPETLISGAVQAASSAFMTARKVMEKIRSPPPFQDPSEGPQPPKM